MYNTRYIMSYALYIVQCIISYIHYMFYLINTWFWILNTEYKDNNFIQKWVIGYINTTYYLYIIRVYLHMHTSLVYILAICTYHDINYNITLQTVILCASICSILLFKMYIRKLCKSCLQCMHSVQHYIMNM